jgi:hypothetical protein
VEYKNSVTELHLVSHLLLVVKDMILSLDADETVIVRTQNKIKRMRGRGGVSIISQHEEKTYRVSFLKRRRLNDNTSLPFGYIRGDC